MTTLYDINGNPIVLESDIESEAKILGLHLMPSTRGELNMVRRARQFTDIKWTPSANIKRKNYAEKDVAGGYSFGFQDTFLAGTEYKGIPYSHGYYNGAYRNYGMVGYQVSLEAFVTANLFASSYFSSVDTYNDETSVYSPYGASCDTLGCYAMGLTTWYGSDTGYQTLVNNGTLVAKFSADDIAANIQNVHLGDILWKKAVHVAVITDVVIDDNDDIFIEVSECTTTGAGNPSVIGGQYGGLSRRELWSLSKFLLRFGGYTVYRYANSSSVTYEQSPFVRLEGEDELHDLMNRTPLIPYMGSGFSYLSGHIPNTNVLIGTTDYAYLAVYKDGTLFNTFTINSATSVATGFSAVGEYEAFLFNSSDGTIANMTTRSVSCHWSVIS